MRWKRSSRSVFSREIRSAGRFGERLGPWGSDVFQKRRARFHVRSPLHCSEFPSFLLKKFPRSNGQPHPAVSTYAWLGSPKSTGIFVTRVVFVTRPAARISDGNDAAGQKHEHCKDVEHRHDIVPQMPIFVIRGISQSQGVILRSRTKTCVDSASLSGSDANPPEHPLGLLPMGRKLVPGAGIEPATKGL